MAEVLLQPLDRARAALNRLLLRSALAGTLVRKDRRIALRAVLAVSVALALTMRAPVLLYAIAPVVLGVPHLAADVRYLILRPLFSPLARAALVIGCASFVALRVAPMLGLHLAAARLEMLSATVALFVAAIGASANARRRRLALVLPLLALLGVFAWTHAYTTQLVFAHLHNVVALVVWAYVFRDRRGGHRTLWIPMLALMVAAAVLLGSTCRLDEVAFTRPRAFGLSLATLASWLAPGLAPRWGAAVALSYVFLQSVHYSIWLSVIPAETIRGDAGRSFRMSARALLRDFRIWGLVFIAALSAAMIAFAARDLRLARDTYLSLSAFHGYLELALLIIAVCGRRHQIAAS